jgi:hypothetical protein
MTDSSCPIHRALFDESNNYTFTANHPNDQEALNVSWSDPVLNSGLGALSVIDPTALNELSSAG